MNQDTVKSFFVKLGLISLAGAGGWYFLVGSQLDAERDLKLAREAQVSGLESGEEAILLYADRVDRSLNRMRQVQGELQLQLDSENAMNMHEHLQTLAESKGLTVSRIEPLRKRIEKHKRGPGLSDLELATQEFRVECDGPYVGAVEYINLLSSGSSITKIGSFRMLPTSKESVRMILQVSTYEIGEFPEVFEEVVSEVHIESSIADTHQVSTQGGAS